MIYYKKLIFLLYSSYFFLSLLYSFSIYKIEYNRKKKIIKWSVCGILLLVNFFSIRDFSYLVNYVTRNFHFKNVLHNPNYMDIIFGYIFENTVGNIWALIENIFLVSAILYMSFVTRRYFFTVAKFEKKMEIYKRILQGCFVCLSLFIYGIILFVRYYKKIDKMGTSRELLHGNEVIRDPLESHMRLQKEFGELENDGIEIFENVRIPKRLESYNFLLTGSMGSGKTVFLMKALMQFYELKRYSIVLDNKGDFCERIGEKEGVVILSPFDARSIAWNVAEDIITDIEAYEFVSYLIQGKGSEKNDFFIKAARDVALGAVIFLQITNPKKWTLLDILKVTERADILEILSEYHSGALSSLKDAGVDIKSGKLTVGSQSTGIFGEIRAELFVLEFISKAWPDTSNGISIKKIARQQDPKNFMIIVPYMQIYVEISGYFSSMVINIFLKELMSLPDSFERRSGVFLDEIGVVARIQSLPDALKVSRSKGICIFAGFQDFGVIRTKYERDGGTETIVGGFAFQLLGRSQSPEYADYVVRLFGKNSYKKIKRSQSIDGSGKKTISQSEDTVVEDAIASGELSSIPTAGKKNDPIFFLKCSEFPVIFKVKIPIVSYPKLFATYLPANWLDREESAKNLIEKGSKTHQNEELKNQFMEEIETYNEVEEKTLEQENKQTFPKEDEKKQIHNDKNSTQYLDDLGV